MSGGLRRGELRALRIEFVDLEQGLIRVERGATRCEGEIKLRDSETQTAEGCQLWPCCGLRACKTASE